MGAPEKPSPSDQPLEVERGGFETVPQKGSDRRSVRISDEDVIWHTGSERVISIVLGASLGFVGSLPIWFGIALFYPSLANYPYSLPAFELAGTLGLSFLAALRNRLLRRVTSRGLIYTIEVERALSWTYTAAIILALYGLFSFEGIIPRYSFPLSIVLLGLYFFLAFPRFTLSGFLKEANDARLSIFQFVEDNQAGNPRYFWLRRGMRGLERQLRNSGLSVSPGILFHGSAYSLFEGRLPDDELKSLAEWMTHLTEVQRVNSIISWLIWESKEAEEQGFGKAPGISDRLTGLPWKKVYRGSAIIGQILAAIATIIGIILTVLGYIKP